MLPRPRAGTLLRLAELGGAAEGEHPSSRQLLQPCGAAALRFCALLHSAVPAAQPGCIVVSLSCNKQVISSTCQTARALTSTCHRSLLAAPAALPTAAAGRRPSLRPSPHLLLRRFPPVAPAAACCLLLCLCRLPQMMPPPRLGWPRPPGHAAPPSVLAALAPAAPPGPGTWQWSQCCPASVYETVARIRKLCTVVVLPTDHQP